MAYRRLKSAQSIQAILVALLLAMRLLTPAGFMPDWSGHGLRITICDDAGMQISAAHHASHGKDKKAKHRPSCPYAAIAGQSFLSPTATSVALTPALETITPASVAAADTPLQRKNERPPSRAPPVLA